MASCNYWVFREGRSAVDGEILRGGLVEALRSVSRASTDSNCDPLLDALLRSGELETALADAGAEDAGEAAAITNALAAYLLRYLTGDIPLDSLVLAAAQLRVPDTLNVSTPEGFAYYALHPLAYAELADSLALGNRYTAVIGIRSIGTTLGAVVTAAFARRNIPAQRISVRPTGHPYDRRTEFNSVQLRWIAARRAEDAEFLVVDEGPGLSGSSLLSVADALLECGVERRRIRFLCSREPDPNTLAAPQAAERWRAFQTHHVSDTIPQVPPDACVYWSGGAWRSSFYPTEEEWPAAWTQMERLKFLSPDRERLFKFTGYGRFGAVVADRARVLADAGFGPRVRNFAGGFLEYEFLQGRPASTEDLSAAMIERIADYCGLRRVEFRMHRPQSHLQEMTRFNLEELTGNPAPDWLVLNEDSVVICDARMQPHEWVITASGTILKTDATTHGDDHFFPGPCDIAWDLAGAMVEWEMDDDATETLLRRYEQRSGDHARRRLPAYIVAYSVFRAGHCAMAAFAMRGSSEAERLTRASQWYAAALTRYLRKGNALTAPAPESSTFPATLCLEPGV